MPVAISSPQAVRNVGQAILRGMALRCPNCGRGHLFRAYLKVADQCDVCGEEFHHHRADDFPPYIAIVITGHLLVGLMLELEFHFEIAPWMYVVTLLPLAVILPLLILPSIKGAVVGFQWASRMHGFGLSDTARVAAGVDYR